MTGNQQTDERYKNPDVLRELYHKRKMTLAEVGDELGVSPTTIKRWMKKNEIPIRDRGDAGLIKGGPPSMKIGSGGYEHFLVCQSGERSRVEVHRLVAVAEHGIDVVKDKDVHHKNGVPWDNRPDNLEPLSRKDHIIEHGKGAPDSVKLAAWSLYESTDLKYREVAEQLDETTTNVSTYIKYVRDGKTTPKIEA
jgi:predicted transcriptional regulator